MPEVSIITPTKDRASFLPILWSYISAQTSQDFEWLVHDSSQQTPPMFNPAVDSRIRYWRNSQPMTIGEKRNFLCSQAQGSTIVHFDDDDYYAPNYIAQMMKFMTETRADFVKLFGFFIYHRAHDAFAYWDLEHDFPLHYEAKSNSPIRMARYAGNSQGTGTPRLGYGFSYVFARKVWQAVQFPNMDHGEDTKFAKSVLATKKFKFDGMQDWDFSSVHVIQGSNTSWCYPQQILQRSEMGKCFPGFRP